MMETIRFDAIPRMMAKPRSRRQALYGLLGAAVAAVAGSGIVDTGLAATKHRGNGKIRKNGGKQKGKKNGQAKVTLCHHGETIRVARRVVRERLKKGAIRGACVYATAGF
jgi:hypothetical protein